MNHSNLIGLAVDYLVKAKQCNPVFAERGSARISEMPDAIGWNIECLVVECKVSMGDLRADIKKPFRKNGNNGLGDRRYYLLTEELYGKIKDMPNEVIPEGWGILVAWENTGVRQIRRMRSRKFNSNVQGERDYLRSRILQVQRFGR